MAIKKTDIYRSLWDSCDQLRGGMDASLYKDYILTLLFLKYVSDRAGQRDALIEVPEGCSFADIRDLRGTKDIGEEIDKAIAGIAEANDLKNVIDRAYFNDTEKFGRGAKMVTTLTALINIFSREELNFSRNRADGDDILGDAYEYLMRNFATESGKSKGQFLYACRGFACRSSRRWSRSGDQRPADCLRPNMRLRFAALKGCRRCGCRSHHFRSGNGHHDARPRENEHDHAWPRGCRCRPR